MRTAAGLQGAVERRVLAPTCLGLHREVRLPVDDAVDHPGAVPVRGVIGVGGGHLHHHGSCGADSLSLVAKTTPG